MQGINPSVNAREAYMSMLQRVANLQELCAQLLDFLAYYVWLHDKGHEGCWTQGEWREYLMEYPRPLESA